MHLNRIFSAVLSDETLKDFKKFISERDVCRKRGFWGYSKVDSFIPPSRDDVSVGRTNPEFVRYLYTAESPYTAMLEARPYLSCEISIAQINILEPLYIADITSGNREMNDSDSYLLASLAHIFSIPAYNNKIYIISQVVSEYIKNNKFGGKKVDGIRFDSSIDKNGKNVTIFNFDKCEAVSSNLYKLESMCYGATSVVPEEAPNLVHEWIKDEFNKPNKLLKALLKNYKG